jgi:hypothetical protein
VVSAEARWMASHLVDRPMTSLRVLDPDEVQTLVFGPVHFGHLTTRVEYLAALREAVGGSAHAVTVQLEAFVGDLPSREEVIAQIWPGVLHETDVGRMFGERRSILSLRKTDIASFHNLEVKVATFIDQTKQDFPGIMQGFHSTRCGWQREWAILSHMERQIIISRLKKLSFGEALALLLYRAQT